MRRMGLVLASVLTVVAGTAFSWPTDHGDGRRTGYLPTQTRFHQMTRVFGVRLDGAVYGSPIVVGTSLIVATENNTVYSLNAGTGALKWKHHLRTPVRQATLPCGNIDPLGITGTPVYDRGTGRVFVITETRDATTVARHEIFGLSATTGRVYVNRRIEVPGTDPKAQQQRAALAADGHGNIFAAFGGLAGDCGNYRGAVISFRASGVQGGKVYVVPTAREAGIWAAGGPVVAPDGTVYVSVGNGAATANPYDFSDSVTRLTWDMQRVDYFAPSTWASDNAADLDLGSLTPIYLANGYILQVGKSGTGYVLHAGSLGGIGGEVHHASLCSAFGVAAITGNTAYVPCSNGVTKVVVNSNGTFSRGWRSTVANGSPVVGNGAIFTLGGSTLYALAGASGGRRGSVSVGTTTRFATPALGPNMVYVGTTTGVVGVRVS